MNHRHITKTVPDLGLKYERALTAHQQQNIDSVTLPFGPNRSLNKYLL